MRRLITTVVTVVILLASTLVLASGIELEEQSAVAMGRVLAVRALLEDASTVFYNAAGLAWLDGFYISGGDILVFPQFNCSDPNGIYADASNTNALVAPPHLYAAYGTSLGSAGRVGFGVGMNFPFGLTLVWPDDFAGRHLSAESSLMIPEILVGLGYAPVKQVSIGATLVISPASVYMKRYLGPKFGFVDKAGKPLADSNVEMAGGGTGLGFNVGMQVRPIEKLFVGFQYRSGIDLEMEGDAHFNYAGDLPDKPFADQKVETAFTLPHILAFGVGYRVHRKWYVEFDADYTFWSAFETIPLRFPEDATGSLDQEVPEYWKDGWIFRLGHEVYLTEALTLRLGSGYDQNPATDKYLSPMLPDADRIFNAIGVGYNIDFESWSLNLNGTYMLTIFRDRTVNGRPCTSDDPCLDDAGEQLPEFNDAGVRNWEGNNFPATYKTTAHLIGLTVGARFGGEKKK